MTPRAGLRSDALANRERVIDAARTLFSERGLDAEMKEIAERAGLGMGTIYRNFATKEDLIEAIVDGLMADCLPRLHEALADPDPHRAVERTLDIAWEMAETHGPLIRRLEEAGFRPSHAKEGDPLIELFTEPLARGAASGVFRTDLDPAFVASYLFRIFPVYLDLRQEFPAETVQRGMSDLLLSGILTQRRANEA